MSDGTISEHLFEVLCRNHNIPYRRVPTGAFKTHDYEIELGGLVVAVEVKQLDENDHDKLKNKAFSEGIETVGAVAPTRRLREQIAAAYRQLKAAAREDQPCFLVVFNNAGFLNYIDSFAVTTAMFGSFGIRYASTPAGRIEVTSHGFLGHRKITRNTCKRLSAIGVLKYESSGSLCLAVYHNPFALIPIPPSALVALASGQFVHPSPHTGIFVSWEPSPIKA